MYILAHRYSIFLMCHAVHAVVTLYIACLSTPPLASVRKICYLHLIRQQSFSYISLASQRNEWHKMQSSNKCPPSMPAACSRPKGASCLLSVFTSPRVFGVQSQLYLKADVTIKHLASPPYCTKTSYTLSQTTAHILRVVNLNLERLLL